MFDPFTRLPHRINHYTFNSVIGRGGFAVVYKATHDVYSMDFAIKVMSLSHHANSNISSFEAEVASLTKLDHPNVIRLYDYFKYKNNLFLVLEYCSGGTLEDIISRNEDLFMHDKIKICSQIISAFKYCNDMSIAHHDIKTSNILFDANKRVKIADFGLSELIGHNNHKMEIKGTLRYLAPELCRRSSFDPFKSDVWSLGVLFFRLFTYQYPFNGRTVHELKEKIIEGYYPEILAGSIGKIVRNMLAMVPEERISLDNLSQLDFFNTNEINSSSPITRIPLSQARYQRKLTKKRFAGANSAIFSNNNNTNSGKDMHPQLAKCISVHMSQTFLTSPMISNGSIENKGF